MKTYNQLKDLPNEELRVMLAKLDGRVNTKHARLWTQTHNSFRSGLKGEWKNFPTEADALDWNRVFPFEDFKIEPCVVVEWLPNYPEDLNACHKVEMDIVRRSASLMLKWCDWLHKICGWHSSDIARADARQRTIALILTLQEQ